MFRQQNLGMLCEPWYTEYPCKACLLFFPKLFFFLTKPLLKGVIWLLGVSRFSLSYCRVFITLQYKVKRLEAPVAVLCYIMWINTFQQVLTVLSFFKMANNWFSTLAFNCNLYTSGCYNTTFKIVIIVIYSLTFGSLYGLQKKNLVLSLELLSEILSTTA